VTKALGLLEQIKLMRGFCFLSFVRQMTPQAHNLLVGDWAYAMGVELYVFNCTTKGYLLVFLLFCMLYANEDTEKVDWLLISWNRPAT